MTFPKLVPQAFNYFLLYFYSFPWALSDRTPYNFVWYLWVFSTKVATLFLLTATLNHFFRNKWNKTGTRFSRTFSSNHRFENRNRNPFERLDWAKLLAQSLITVSKEHKVDWKMLFCVTLNYKLLKNLTKLPYHELVDMFLKDTLRGS